MYNVLYVSTGPADAGIDLIEYVNKSIQIELVKQLAAEDKIIGMVIGFDYPIVNIYVLLSIKELILKYKGKLIFYVPTGVHDELLKSLERVKSEFEFLTIACGKQDLLQILKSWNTVT